MQYLTKRQNIEFLLYASVAFFVPLFFNHPQLLVGSCVNAALYLGAGLRFKKTLPLIFLPSLALLLSGIIFKELSIFLIYMLPFIWVGNLIFIQVVRKMAGIQQIMIAPVLKALFLFLSAFSLFTLGLIPVQFLSAMGLMQLYTGLIGALSGSFIRAAMQQR